MKKIYILYSLLYCSVFYAQDIHWSQPFNTLLYINPAFTAAESRYNASVNVRDQWRAVDKAYRTGMAAGDFRVVNSKTMYVGLGFIAASDVSAGTKYQTAFSGLTASCLLRVSKTSMIGVGIGGNFSSVSAPGTNFSWGSQFDGKTYNAAYSSGEAALSPPAYFFDLNAGVSFVYDKSNGARYANNHMKWIAGYGISHINTPNISINGGLDALFIKHSVFVKGALPLKEDLTLQPMLLIYSQGPYVEVTTGALLRFALGEASQITSNKTSTGLSLGLMYRYKDAIAPTFQLDKGNMIVGLSYDVNVSAFSNASKFRGGFELSLRFRAAGNKPAKQVTMN
jgi:type IX secretion system PorP/SprF family membrane protein